MHKHPEFDDRLAQVQKLCGGWPDVILEVAGVPEAFLEAMKMVRIGGRVIEVGNISAGLQVQIPPSMITFKSLEIVGVAMYPPQYLKKSLDFLSQHMDRFPYAQMCDATFPLTSAAEAMDKSERREVTRAGLLPAAN
jgi:threonine dehydrogenase-like Zn-dependent dehydrogenase